MIDPKKIRMMTKIAIYEQGDGKEAMKIHSYGRQTYLNIRRMVSFFALTFAYILAAGLYCFFFIDEIFLRGFGYDYRSLLIRLLGGYIIVLAAGLIITGRIYRKRYDRALKGLKDYDRELYNLNKYLDKEVDS